MGILVALLDLFMWIMSNITIGFAKGAFTGLSLVMLIVAFALIMVGFANDRQKTRRVL